MHSAAFLLVCWATVGSLRAAEQPSGRPPGTMLPPTASTGLALIADGRCQVTIIYPGESKTWPALARQLAGAIEGLGATAVPLVADHEAVPVRLGPLREDLRGRPLILLGDLNTNRAFFAYYASYYTCCDARSPGPDGYELRTVVRPFGWAANTLLVGASNLQGGQAAVARLIQRIKAVGPGPTADLPYLLEVKLGAELTGLVAPAIEALDGSDSHPGGDDAFTRNAHLYFYTGDERFARRSRNAAMAAVKGGVGFPTGDYTMENLAAAWRRVSCSPAFSPADRAAVDAKLYETLGVQAKSWWRIPPERGIGNRHQTTGGLAFWTLTRAMRELANPDPEAARQLDRWQREATAYCDGLLRHYWDDEDDYQSPDSTQNTASYAMQSGRLDWFESGLGRRAAQRLMMTVDNLGWSAGIQGYGDALPGWERFPQDAGMLMGACAFIYQDGGYNWVLERFPMLEDSWGSLQPWGLHQFDTGGRIKAVQPEWLTGLRVARFTPYKLERINSGEFMTTAIMDNFRPGGLVARPVPAELAFDKLMYRGGVGEGDPYLLLQGSAGSTLTTIDMNSLVRYGDAGKLWLVHNTGRRSLYFKNAIYISNGTNTDPLAPSCELLAQRDDPTAALAVSRLPQSRGMTWTRNLLIAKGRFTAVIDGLRAEQPGRYSLSCAWRTPGFASLEGGRWVARQDDAVFNLLPGSPDGLDSNRPPSGDGATRPTTLRQNRTLEAAPGDQVVFENVFYIDSQRHAQRFETRRVAPGVILVRDAAAGGMFLVAAGDRGIHAPGLDSDALAVLIAPGEVRSVEGRRLTLAELTLDIQAGAVPLQAEQRQRIESALEALWAATPAAAPSRPAASQPVLAGAGPQAVWNHAGPATRGSLIDGVRFVSGPQISGLSLLATDGMMPLLRAEPRLMGRQGSELVPVSRAAQAEHAPAAEPALRPLAGAEFTLELPRVAQVAELDVFGDTFGETLKMPAGTLRLELTFSRDGFQADRRTRRLAVERRPTYHNLYKGHSYLFECYHIGELNEGASAIKARVIDGPSKEWIITDVQVRSAERSGRREAEMRPLDLDGDGNDEILTWTGEGDLVLLRLDGSQQWGKALEPGIAAVDAWDLEHDGRREVFVSRLDRRVDVFNQDGSPRWSKDFSEAQKESGNRFFGDGSLVYGMTVWQPKTAAKPRVLCTSYWYSTWLDTDGRWIDAFRRAGQFTQIRRLPAGLPGAGGMAIRCSKTN